MPERNGHPLSAWQFPPPRRAAGRQGPGRSLPRDEDEDRDLRESQIVPERTTPSGIRTLSGAEGDDGEEAVGTGSDAVGWNGELMGVTPPGNVVVADGDGIRGVHVYGGRAKGTRTWSLAVDVVKVETKLPATGEPGGEGTADAPVDLDQQIVVRLRDPDPLVLPRRNKLRGVEYVQ
jgi:hypothetical protein